MVVVRIKYKYLIVALSGIVLVCLLFWGFFGLLGLNRPAYGDVNYSFAVSGMPQSTKQMAIVLEDMGEGREGVAEALALETDITFAVLPLCQYSTQDAQAATEAGKEVMLHLPMEPAGNKTDAAAFNGITGDMNTQAIREYIEKAAKSVPGAKGAGDHQGEVISQNMSAMRAVLSQLQEEGAAYYLDSRSVQSNAPQLLCRDIGLPYAQRNVNIDGRMNAGYIKRQLLIAADIAEKYGKSIAVGHLGQKDSALMVQVIADMLPELQEKGIEVVFVSELFE